MKTKSELKVLFEAFATEAAKSPEPMHTTYDDTDTEAMFMCFCAGYTLGVTQQQVGDV